MLEIKNVTKRYRYTKVLNRISMTLPDCGLISIVGPSGCGKSTLLHIIGGIDKKYQGKVLFDGKKHTSQRKNVGFLFQSFHLIQWLKVIENIRLPLFYRSKEYPEYSKDLDLSYHLYQKINDLSLGQRQRVAFLRAISFYPHILLCDEPTASLDMKHALEIMELLKEESKKRLVIFVSHDIKLVQAYSDEIYEMKDGKIMNHIINNQCSSKEQVTYKNSLKKPRILLSLLSMKVHTTRMIQVCIGLILSLFTILMTLSLTQGFRNQLNLYIESIIPSSSVSFRLKNHQSINTNIFYNDSKIEHVHYYPNEYELLGIGKVKDRYNQSDTLDIYDDSGYIDDLDILYGRNALNEYEIVLSKSTAIHYLQDNDIKKLINTKVKIWFKYLNEVKGLNVKVVGITKDNTENDSIYYNEGSHLLMISHIFGIDNVECSYGLLYLRDVNKTMDYLCNNYKEYEFKEVGKNTKETIDSFMDKANYVLLFFSVFALISSLFLVGEVMYLEVISKRKDISIMKCFGANRVDIVCFVFYQCFILYIVSVFISFVLFLVFKEFLNYVFAAEMLINMSLIIIDWKLFFYVYLFVFLLILMASSLALLYALRINVVDSLKINS